MAQKTERFLNKDEETTEAPVAPAEPEEEFPVDEPEDIDETPEDELPEEDEIEAERINLLNSIELKLLRFIDAELSEEKPSVRVLGFLKDLYDTLLVDDGCYCEYEE